jgi:hypothetical protein
MSMRNTSLKAEPVNTSLGILELDSNGVVINQEALGVTDEQIAAIPGFVSTDDFPVKAQPAAAATEPAAAATEPAAVLTRPDTGEEPPSAEFLAQAEVAGGLMADPATFNSAGTLAMDALNSALKAANLPTVNGAGRDALVEFVKKQ